MLTLKDVTYSYPSGKHALVDVSLSIAAGERVAVMGANGSGKTTLARIIAGLAESTRGTLHIDLPESLPQVSRIGILFQNPDNQMVSSVVENEIAFALENLATPMAEMEQRVTETLKRFGIKHLRTRLTHELSGGEKQRVALASVMIANPRILILDEPDSFLDASGKEILEAELDRLHEELPELIEIRITQYPDVAKRYPRMLVFVDGRLEADHQPAKIFGNSGFCERAGLVATVNGNDESGSDSIGLRVNANTLHSIELKEISFAYSEEQPVLEDLSFVWSRGEVIGIAGDSGSGKTTLGLLLAGLLKPINGELLFFDDENSLLGLKPRPGWVAAVFQQSERQFFLPTCLEEVAFGPRNFGQLMTGNSVSFWLELVGLEPNTFLERDPFSLSMGEKRRLAFASILSINSPFIVFDEPTCGLDPAGVGRFVQLVRALKAANVGQMIISHDWSLLTNICDRTVRLTRH